MDDRESPQARLNLALEYTTALAKYMTANMNTLTDLVKNMAESLELVGELIWQMEEEDADTAHDPE